MKKEKIKKSLSFKKNVIIDLKSITGGSAPATGPVNTYKCNVPSENDPVPNPSTCLEGAKTLADTFNQCNTLHGAACTNNSLNVCYSPGC